MGFVSLLLFNTGMLLIWGQILTAEQLSRWWLIQSPWAPPRTVRDLDFKLAIYPILAEMGGCTFNCLLHSCFYSKRRCCTTCRTMDWYCEWVQEALSDWSPRDIYDTPHHGFWDAGVTILFKNVVSFAFLPENTIRSNIINPYILFFCIMTLPNVTDRALYDFRCVSCNTQSEHPHEW